MLNKGQCCTLVTNGNALRAGREDDTFLSYTSRSSHFIHELQIRLKQTAAGVTHHVGLHGDDISAGEFSRASSTAPAEPIWV